MGIKLLMANYAVIVTFLLGIFLPSNLAILCGDSQADVEAQCAATGGQCFLSPNCGLGRNNLLEPDLEDQRAIPCIDRSGWRQWQSSSQCCCCVCVPDSNPTDCFEENTLFVEESFAMNSIQDCFEACTSTTCCEFFTWSTTNLNCGLRCYHPNSLINAPTQRTGKRSGITPQLNKVWVGKAISNISGRLQCQLKCQQDSKCKSCTYNEPNSPNPSTCVLNYGPTLRKINLPSNSGI